MRFYQAMLVPKDSFDQLVDQIIREIGSANDKIVHSDGGIVLVLECVRTSGSSTRSEKEHNVQNSLQNRPSKVS